MTDVTINPQEVAFYRSLADRWWDTQGPFWPLHRLNKLRVTWIVAFLEAHFGLGDNASKPLEGLRILDVGCGGGILSESMARLGARVTGIDVVEKNIHVAALHASRADLDIDYQLAPAADLRRQGRSFDVVLNMEVVEHVADMPAFMADCAALTAPGGVMFVATINRTLLGWLFAIVGAEYVLRWLPKGTHRWQDFRTPAEIAAELSKHGLEVERRTGVHVNPLSRRFSLTNRLAVNYMLAALRQD